LLVAGCCIGAGMLGLPVLSAQAGFMPSLFTFVICWLFMLCTGLLLLEVNLWYGGNISIITMSRRTLGRGGEIISWLVFLFLFYSLMVAYVSASGSLISDFMGDLTGASWHHSIGGALFTLFFGILLYLGTGAADQCNRFLMLGLVISYVIMIALGASYVKSDFLKHTDWTATAMVIPAVIVSFGFHNLIPTLTTYFGAHKRSLKWAIIIGSSIPLFIYLAWEWLILGIVPLHDFQSAIDQGEIATEALKDAVGTSWVLEVAQAFAFFSIVTSFLSVALSFVDFLSDGLQIKKTPQGKAILALLVLIPPFLCSLLYPTIFLKALNAAGGYGAVVLFGLLPALMVWRGRYVHKIASKPLVPGGKLVLVLVIAFSLWVISLQII
jgi:tyrosine-specific transport protein